MKKFNYYPLLLLAALITVFSSCQKNGITKSTTTSATTTSATSIAIGTITSSAASTTTTDTVYLVNCFSKNSKKDSVAFSALPAAISTYLTANYAGYTFKKAFKITDSLGVINSYIVVINYNSNPVGLKFSSTGAFVQVLEQMAGHDFGGGRGFHEGGPFNDRDGHFRDTIALSALPSAVSTFFSTTYPKDTLLHASVTPDTTYILISKDTLLYATNISKTGTLIKRVKIPGAPGIHTSVTQANLPSAITTYLTTTYPGYVFNKAFSETVNSVVQGYDVFITANNTNYVVKFDGSGVFVKVFTLH